jgi:polysaccharide export outer membrane protein
MTARLCVTVCEAILSIYCSKPLFVLASVAFLAAGCAVMPMHGPEAPSLASGAQLVVNSSEASTGAGGTTTAQPYILVNVNNDILGKMRSAQEPRFAGLLTDRRAAPDLRIGAGDVLSLAIFEAAPGGLFTPPVTAGARPGNFVELPPQTVGRDGSINVPYAGSVRVAGQRPVEIERLIEQRLRNRAIEPQVVLTLREQRSAQASVLGEVNAATKFTINPQGERILDAIARAGGSRHPAYESVVVVQRDRRRAQTTLATLLREPQSNIFIQPGDSIFVSREQRHFVALGAQTQNGLFFFDSESVTLAYAMGKAGGLLDERAEPAGVFIYRLEPRKQVERYGVELGHIPDKIVPVIYQVNLRDPSGFFIAQNFAMQDRDVIFAANSPSVDIAKLLQFVRIGVNAGREGTGLFQAR